jgi:hypothetical protein
MHLISSSLSFAWEFAKIHPGVVLVVIGILGEIVLEWNKTHGKWGWLKKLFWVLLIIGLLLEFSEAAKTDNEVIALKNGIDETSTNIANLDPTNQPITSISAIVTFEVDFNSHPFPNSPLPKDVTTLGQFDEGFKTIRAELIFFNSTNKNAERIVLTCSKREKEPNDSLIWSSVLQFQYDRAVKQYEEYGGQLFLDKMIGNKVNCIANFDSVSLKLFMNQIDGRINMGDAILVFNQTMKTFGFGHENISGNPMIFSNVTNPPPVTTYNWPQ